jgi:PPOX class probable F420-dependent enzyme
MSRDAMDAFLERPLLARLATIDGDRPRVLPMWFWWDGADMWMETSPTFPNARILRRNPNAAVSVDEAIGPFEMRAVLMRGRVEVIDSPAERVTTVVRRIYERYMSADQRGSDAGQAMLAGGHLLLRFTPERIVSWDTTA